MGSPSKIRGGQGALTISTQFIGICRSALPLFPEGSKESRCSKYKHLQCAFLGLKILVKKQADCNPPELLKNERTTLGEVYVQNPSTQLFMIWSVKNQIYN